MTYRRVLPTFCDFNMNIAESCPDKESLTLFLLMKIIFPVMLPNYVEKLFHLYLGTAVPADVQLLPL